MDQAQNFLTDLLNFAREGYANANGVLGLFIAVVAAFMMGSYNPRSIFTTTLGATVAFIVIRVLVPVLDHNAPLRLPNILTEGFWREVGLLAVGLFIIISLLYLVKKVVMRGFGGGGGH
ncbi:MAG: hypothetical protein U1E87_04140 [Alphaproteobacteria bacterium]